MHTHTKKILMIVIACNVVAVALYVIFFLQVRTKNEMSSKLLNSIELGEEKDSRLNSLKKAIADTEESRAKLNDLFLNPDQTVVFIEQVEKLAKESNLTIETSDVSTVERENNLATLQLKVDTTGSWSDNVYFLKQLENMPYSLYIDQMSLNKASLVTQSGDGKETTTRSIWKNAITFQVMQAAAQ